MFDNHEAGFKQMIQWIWHHIDSSSEQLLFAFEHTGLYSLSLWAFLSHEQYIFTIISGLELKRPLWLRRGKSDRMDAQTIAEYAYEKREKIKPY